MSNPLAHAYPISFHCDTPGCPNDDGDQTIALPGGFYCLDCARPRAYALFLSPFTTPHDIHQAWEALTILRLARREP